MLQVARRNVKLWFLIGLILMSCAIYNHKLRRAVFVYRGYRLLKEEMCCPPQPHLCVVKKAFTQTIKGGSKVTVPAGALVVLNAIKEKTAIIGFGPTEGDDKIIEVRGCQLDNLQKLVDTQVIELLRGIRTDEQRSVVVNDNKAFSDLQTLRVGDVVRVRVENQSSVDALVHKIGPIGSRPGYQLGLEVLDPNWKQKNDGYERIAKNLLPDNTPGKMLFVSADNVRKKTDEVAVKPPEGKKNRHSSHAQRQKKEPRPDIDEETMILSEMEMKDGDPKSGLSVGSMVEVGYDDPPIYGTIKWIGQAFQDPDEELVACIEVDPVKNIEENDVRSICKKYFRNSSGLFLIIPTSLCRNDSRFQDEPIEQCMDLGFIVEIPGLLPPINSSNVFEFTGFNKGIQGNKNSCYLDATLFAMFTFSSVLDSVLLRRQTEYDPSCYCEVQQVLRECIVNPLRKNYFVHHSSVMRLRNLLHEFTSITGLTHEEKDPEELLRSMLAQLLRAEPFLEFSSGHQEYYYQLFIEPTAGERRPTVQELLNESFVESGLKLKKVPSCFIIQMPRYGPNFKSFPKIIPTQSLDVTDIIQNSARECSICGQVAQYECKECFKEKNHHFSFCPECIQKVHMHENRRQHQFQEFHVSKEIFDVYGDLKIPQIRHQKMELFAVLCIKTSHYVAFAKCHPHPNDTSWCFFDSMADRQGGQNIPEMIHIPNLFDGLNLPTTPTMAMETMPLECYELYQERLLCDAYMCFYHSPQVSMYK